MNYKKSKYVLTRIYLITGSILLFSFAALLFATYLLEYQRLDAQFKVDDTFQMNLLSKALGDVLNKGDKEKAQPMMESLLEKSEYYALAIYKFIEGTRVDWILLTKTKDESGTMTIQSDVDPFKEKASFTQLTQEDVLFDTTRYRIVLFPYEKRILESMIPVFIKVGGIGLILFLILIIILPLWIRRVVQTPLKQISDAVEESAKADYKISIDVSKYGEWKSIIEPIQVLQKDNVHQIESLESIQSLLTYRASALSFDEWAMRAIDELCRMGPFKYGVFYVKNYTTNSFESIAHFGIQPKIIEENQKVLNQVEIQTYLRKKSALVVHTPQSPEAELLSKLGAHMDPNDTILISPIFEGDQLVGMIHCVGSPNKQEPSINLRYIKLNIQLMQIFFSQTDLSTLTIDEILEKTESELSKSPAKLEKKLTKRTWTPSNDSLKITYHEVFKIIQENQWAEAIPYFIEALKSIPHVYESLKGLGYSYYMEKDYHLSICFFEAYRQLFPNDEKTLRMLAASYLLNKDFLPAEQILKRLMEDHPDDESIQKMLRLVYQHLHSKERTPLEPTSETYLV